MKSFMLIALLMPTLSFGYTMHLINGSDVTVHAELHTSLACCCHATPVICSDARCEIDVPSNKTIDYAQNSSNCKGACWTSARLWVVNGKQLDTADFGAGACEDVWVMIYGKNGDYHVDKKGGGDVGHIIQKGFQDFGQAIQIDKIAKTPQILQKGFEIIGLGTEIAALEIKLGSIQASQAAASGFLDGMKKMTGGLLSGLPEIVKALQVRKIEFEGSMRDLAKGVYPKGTFEFVIAGKTISLTDVQMDPRKPADALLDLVNKGVDEVKKGFEQIIRFSDQITKVFTNATKPPEPGAPAVALTFVPKATQLVPIKYGDVVCLRDWQGKYFDGTGYDVGCAAGWTLVKLDPKSSPQKPVIIPSLNQVMYGDTIGLISNSKYIKSENDSDHHLGYSPFVGEWERWTIMNADPKLNQGGVTGGDSIQLKNVSFKGMFHSDTGSAKGTISANGNQSDVGSQWIIHPRTQPVKGDDAGQGYIWNNPPYAQVKCDQGATVNDNKSGCRCLLPQEPGYKGNNLKKVPDNVPRTITYDHWVCE